MGELPDSSTTTRRVHGGTLYVRELGSGRLILSGGLLRSVTTRDINGDNVARVCV